MGESEFLFKFLSVESAGDSVTRTALVHTIWLRLLFDEGDTCSRIVVRARPNSSMTIQKANNEPKSPREPRRAGDEERKMPASRAYVIQITASPLRENARGKG